MSITESDFRIIQNVVATYMSAAYTELMEHFKDEIGVSLVEDQEITGKGNHRLKVLVDAMNEKSWRNDPLPPAFRQIFLDAGYLVEEVDRMVVSC